MPLTATLTDDLIRSLSPDEATFKRAQEIARAKKFQNLGVSADGTWLFGECLGSAVEPYRVSADFHDAANPDLRSSSPSRKLPDTYSLALLLTYVNDPDSFGEGEPTEDLLIKREKRIVLDEKKKSGSAVPRKMNKAATEKKVAAQREGLELLEKLLVELVAEGQWFEATRLEKIERLSKQLGDAHLPASMYALRKFLFIAKQKELGDEEKMAQAADVVGILWATIERARTYLNHKLHGDETRADADAVIEDVLGKPIPLAELREKGYVQTNLSLMEVAFERIDDESRQQRVEISHLLDVATGAIHQSIVYRPFKGLSQVPEQPSYQSPLTVAEATINPGFVNRRIRWENGIEQIAESMPANYLADVYGRANVKFEDALNAFRTQLQHLLAPREAVVFVRCKKIGKIGERVVIEDASGARIEMKDRRKDYSNAANLVRAAGMLGKDHPAVLVRLFVLPLQNTIVGLPLAAITAKQHLRLGL